MSGGGDWRIVRRPYSYPRPKRRRRPDPAWLVHAVLVLVTVVLTSVSIWAAVKGMRHAQQALRTGMVAGCK